MAEVSSWSQWDSIDGIDGSEQLIASLPSVGLFCPRCVAREHCAFHSFRGLEDLDREEGRRRGGTLLNLLQPQAPAQQLFSGNSIDWAAVQQQVSCGTARHIGLEVADNCSQVDDASTDSGGSEGAVSIESDGSSTEQHRLASQVQVIQRRDQQVRPHYQHFQQSPQQHWFNAVSDMSFSKTGVFRAQSSSPSLSAQFRTTTTEVCSNETWEVPFEHRRSSDLVRNGTVLGHRATILAADQGCLIAR